MNKTTVFQPQYYNEFHCTMNECKENCCNYEWCISIDKSTYEKYLKSDNDLSAEVLKNIELISENPFEARIKITEEGKCNFFTKDGLCRIHAEYGEDYLGKTCKSYPRKICNNAGSVEAFLEISCEAAAELILFDNRTIILQEEVWEHESPINISRIVESHKYVDTDYANDIFHLIRAVSLIILQTKRYTIQLRLMILGLFISRIRELLQADNDGKIDFSAIIELCESFIKKTESGFYDAMTGQEILNVDLSINFIIEMFNILNEKNNEIIKRCIKQAYKGLGIINGKSIENFHENYNNEYEIYFSDKEYIFENLLVNHIFSEGFPFNHRFRDNVMKNYQEILVKYNLVKFLLVGICVFYNKFNKEKIIECTSIFSRFFDHNMLGALIMD